MEVPRDAWRPADHGDESRQLRWALRIRDNDWKGICRWKGECAIIFSSSNFFASSIPPPTFFHRSVWFTNIFHLRVDLRRCWGIYFRPCEMKMNWIIMKGFMCESRWYNMAFQEFGFRKILMRTDDKNLKILSYVEPCSAYSSEISDRNVAWCAQYCCRVNCSLHH